MLENENLNGKERLELILEAGIASIPTVGGALQTLYFGSKNEKRFKRIEIFYEELGAELELVKSKIPNVNEVTDKDIFLGLLETINDEIEKMSVQSKIDYFKYFYKNILIESNKNDWNTKEYFLGILINLTDLELRILNIAYEKYGEKYDTLDIPNVNKNIVKGCLNRLSDYGLIYKSVSGISFNKILEKYTLSETGKDFVLFITK